MKNFCLSLVFALLCAGVSAQAVFYGNAESAVLLGSGQSQCLAVLQSGKLAVYSQDANKTWQPAVWDKQGYSFAQCRMLRFFQQWDNEALAFVVSCENGNDRIFCLALDAAGKPSLLENTSWEDPKLNGSISWYQVTAFSLGGFGVFSIKEGIASCVTFSSSKKQSTRLNTGSTAVSMELWSMPFDNQQIVVGTVKEKNSLSIFRIAEGRLQFVKPASSGSAGQTAFFVTSDCNPALIELENGLCNVRQFYEQGESVLQLAQPLITQVYSFGTLGLGKFFALTAQCDLVLVSQNQQALTVSSKLNTRPVRVYQTSVLSSYGALLAWIEEDGKLYSQMSFCNSDFFPGASAFVPAGAKVQMNLLDTKQSKKLVPLLLQIQDSSVLYSFTLVTEGSFLWTALPAVNTEPQKLCLNSSSLLVQTKDQWYSLDAAGKLTALEAGNVLPVPNLQGKDLVLMEQAGVWNLCELGM